MNDDGPDYQHEAAHHDDLLRQQGEDMDERLEDCSFAAAVATVADYLEARAPNSIPRERTLEILYTLAGWPDNPPIEGSH